MKVQVLPLLPRYENINMITDVDERFVLENAVACGIKQPKEVYIDAIISREVSRVVDVIACELHYNDVIGVGVWIKDTMCNVVVGRQIAITEAMKDVAAKFKERYVL